MKITAQLSLLAFVLIFVSACSPRLTPFTESLYREQAWTDNELKQIQFYLSEDIVLKRRAVRGNSKIEDGEIRIENGEKVEQVVIREGTPGVFLFRPKDNHFAVAFEDNDDKYLVFGPSARRGNRYTLLASSWKRRGGQVTYNGRKYFTPSESAMAVLMVDLKKKRNRSVKTRTAGGRKID